MRGQQALSRLMRWGSTLALVGTCALISGCSTKAFLDPSEMVPAGIPQGLVVPILPTIDPIDEPTTEFASAQDVRPEDSQVISADYVIGKNDLISVSIFDLVNQGIETVRTARVSETGMLSLPLLPEPVRAAGLTESQLQRAIAKRYEDAKLLPNAQVTVTVNEARQRTFSITGAVQRPGQYAIVESDFRLLDALVMGNEVTTPPDYVYVIRRVASETPTTQPAAETPKTTTPKGNTEDLLAPRSEYRPARQPMLANVMEAPATQPVKDELPPAEDGGRVISIDGKSKSIGATEATLPATEPAGAAAPSDRRGIEPEPFEFGANPAEQTTRIIRVPYQPLRNGDLRYNIVIRPNDMVIVPSPVIGEYYVGGHVQRVGVYSLSGRQITLKQAVISAGMLDPLADPQRAYVVRRVKRGGRDQELFVQVKLAQIFEGKQPDVFLKPNDQVLVGTNAFAPFLAAIRSAFRVTYGGGFTYDRNFAYGDNYYNSSAR